MHWSSLLSGLILPFSWRMGITLKLDSPLLVGQGRPNTLMTLLPGALALVKSQTFRGIDCA